MYNTLVQSVLPYGSKIWEMSKTEQQKLNAVEMDFLRRGCRVSRLEYIENTEIRHRMEKQQLKTYDIYMV